MSTDSPETPPQEGSGGETTDINQETEARTEEEGEIATESAAGEAETESAAGEKETSGDPPAASTEPTADATDDGPAAAEEEPSSPAEPEEPVPETPQKKESSVSFDASTKDDDDESAPTAPATPVADEESSSSHSVIVTLSGGRKRPPFKYNPDKVTLRFLFANKDGLTVTIECNPQDTVGEVKGALLSVWPEGLPDCSGGDQLRLICMGKGMLMPDTRTLEDCQVPVFKTHPTPVNVSVRPDVKTVDTEKHGQRRSNNLSGNGTDQGCACVIL